MLYQAVVELQLRDASIELLLQLFHSQAAMAVGAQVIEPARHLRNQQTELFHGSLHLPHGELDLGHRSGNRLRSLAGLSGLEHLIRTPQAPLRAMVDSSLSGLKGIIFFLVV